MPDEWALPLVNGTEQKQIARPDKAVRVYLIIGGRARPTCPCVLICRYTLIIVVPLVAHSGGTTLASPLIALLVP